MAKLKYPFSTFACLLFVVFLSLYLFALDQGIGGGSVDLIGTLETVIGLVVMLAFFASVAAILESFQKPNVFLFLFNLFIFSIYLLLFF